MIRTRQKSLIVVAVVLWFGAVAAGFAAWERYDATPGNSLQPKLPQRHPATGRWELTMFTHPRCPCTRASLTELREILRRTHTDLDTRIVFVRPKGVAPDWERGELWDSAAEIPHVRVDCDMNGMEASSAGATVSGHVVLRNPAGEIVFRGGITKSRGRIGENTGRRIILALLQGDSVDHSETPTFGCPLFTPRECCEKEGVACQP